MSYTPDNQLLEGPIDSVLSGIENLNAAIKERIIKAHEWNESHIKELKDLRLRLTALEQELLELKQSTW